MTTSKGRIEKGSRRAAWRNRVPPFTAWGEFSNGKPPLYAAQNLTLKPLIAGTVLSDWRLVAELHGAIFGAVDIPKGRAMLLPPDQRRPNDKVDRTEDDDTTVDLQIAIICMLVVTNLGLFCAKYAPPNPSAAMAASMDMRQLAP